MVKIHNVAAPTSFAVDIPTGPARLFQALLVFEDTTTGGTSFYYGDFKDQWMPLQIL